MCGNLPLFKRTGLQKMRESIQPCSEGWLVSRIFEDFQQPAIQTNIVQHFCAADFLSSNKCVPANMRKWFYKSSLLKNEETGGIFVYVGSELWTPLKISNSKLKNFKHIAVNVLSWAYPVVSLSCRPVLRSGLLDPDPDSLVSGMDPEPSIIKQK